METPIAIVLRTQCMQIFHCACKLPLSWLPYISFHSTAPPPYTSRDFSAEPSKYEINIAAPGAVHPFPKRSGIRSEIHQQYQPLAASLQTTCADENVAGCYGYNSSTYLTSLEPSLFFPLKKKRRKEAGSRLSYVLLQYRS